MAKTGEVLLKGRRWAPPVGADEGFDDTVEKVVEALEASGNPEGITPEFAREVLAMRMTERGGKSYVAGDAKPEVEEPLPARMPHTGLRIPTPPAEPYWYDDPDQALLLDHHITTRRALGARYVGALLITGPAGAGKTLGVEVATRRLGLPLLVMDCVTITDPQKWFGRREIDHDGTRYVESDFMRGVREGAVILLDEITRLHPTLTNGIMPLLAGAQALHLSELNVTVNVNPLTVFLATANIGSQFGGTHRMDWALRERFPYTIERAFPPRDDEIKVLVTHTGVDPDAASNLVDTAIESRRLHDLGDLRSPISTRTLVAAAWLVASGMTERQAMDFTAIPTFDGSADGGVGEKSERQIIRGIMDMKLGRG